MRLMYGKTQTEISEVLNISKSVYCRYENEVIGIPEKHEVTLQGYYDSHNMNDSLYAKFDYVRVTFKTNNVQNVIETILRLDIDYFVPNEKAYYGYLESYSLGDIVVMSSLKGSEKGVLIQLSGRGCRNYDAVLDELNDTWFNFFQRCKNFKGHFTRVDVAIDDTEEVMSINTMKDKMEAGLFQMDFRNWYPYGKEESGITLYFGSRKSELFFRFYQKGLEIASKEDIPVEEVEVKNRYEIVLKNEKASKFVDQFLSGSPIGGMALGLMANYLSFYDMKQGMNVLNLDWYNLIYFADYVDLRIEPVKPSYEGKRRWVQSQVARTAKTLFVIDMKNGTSDTFDMIRQASLGEVEEKIIEIETTPLSEMVLKETEETKIEREKTENEMLEKYGLLQLAKFSNS